jgi:hypothetical protein
MTVTTLERVELPVEDLEIPCDSTDCDNTATLIVRRFCGCLCLSCEHCVAWLTTWLAESVGELVRCLLCNNEIVVSKISDFVISIDKL